MNAEKQRLLDDLQTLGIKEGDVILVHSSMKAIGTSLPPEDIIDVLQTAVGDQGTLLLPALSWANVSPENPVFKSDSSEPCIGLLPRTFWRCPGVVRSVHPTHSVCARGLLAEQLTRDHPLDDSPVGPNSPFMKLADVGGKMLFIGETLACCTFMHGLEEIVGTDYTLLKDKVGYVVDGQERYMYRHDFSHHRQEYQRIKNILSSDELKAGRFGQGVCYLVDANALMQKGVETLRRYPHYFVTELAETTQA